MARIMASSLASIHMGILALLVSLSMVVMSPGSEVSGRLQKHRLLQMLRRPVLGDRRVARPHHRPRPARLGDHHQKLRRRVRGCRHRQRLTGDRHPAAVTEVVVTNLVTTVSLSARGSENEILTAIGTVIETVIATAIVTAIVNGIVDHLHLVTTPGGVHHLRDMMLVGVDHLLVMMLERVRHLLVILDIHPVMEVDHRLVMTLAKVDHHLAIQDTLIAMVVDHLHMATTLAEVRHRLAIQDTHIAMEVEHLMLARARCLLMMLVRVGRLLVILDTLTIVGRAGHHPAILDILGTRRHRMMAEVVRLLGIHMDHLQAIRMVVIHHRTWAGHHRHIQATAIHIRLQATRRMVMAMVILHLGLMDILATDPLLVSMTVREILVARVMLVPRVTLVARASPMVDIMVTEATMAFHKEVETLVYQLLQVMGEAPTMDTEALKATTATAPEVTLARATLAEVAMEGEIEVDDQDRETVPAMAAIMVDTVTVAVVAGSLHPRFS